MMLRPSYLALALAAAISLEQAPEVLLPTQSSAAASNARQAHMTAVPAERRNKSPDAGQAQPGRQGRLDGCGYPVGRLQALGKSRALGKR